MVECDACTRRIYPGEVAIVTEGAVYCTETCQYEGEVIEEVSRKIPRCS